MSHAVEVTARFDEEAGVWFTEACSVPGLVTEAKTLDGLLQKVACMAAELDPFYSESNQKALAESIASLHAGKVVRKTLGELQALE